MNILIAAASFASEISGVQRHALNLVRCLLPRPEVATIHLVLAPWQSSFLEDSELAHHRRVTTHIAQLNRSSLSRNLWYYRRLPEMAARLHANLVHLSCPMPVNAAAFHCPTVVTLHDMYPYDIPMNFGFSKFPFNRLVVRQCLRNIDAIACVSDTTVARVSRYFPAAVAKAVRIYNCVEPVPDTSATAPMPNWDGEPFFLSVAQHRRNKNLPLVIRAFERLLSSGQIAPKAKLVIVGIRGPETATIERLVTRSGLIRSVCFLQGISDSELQWCYRHCEALLAPSITEGFGLPIAEGILAGCRIVASDIPAHREICHRPCTFIQLQEKPEQAMTAAIVAALGAPKPPPEFLPRLSAPVLAEQYVNLYRHLIAVSAKDRSENRPVALTASERPPL